MLFRTKLVVKTQRIRFEPFFKKKYNDIDSDQLIEYLKIAISQA